MVLCEKQCLVSIFLSFFCCFFLGLETLERSPTGQQVTGLSSLARTECIPVRCKALCCSPDTMTRSITAASRIVWLLPAPYNASIHPSGFPPDWRQHKWFNQKRTDRHFPPDHIPCWASHWENTGKDKLIEVFEVGLGKLSWQTVFLSIDQAHRDNSQSFTNSNIRTEHVGRRSRPST